MTASLPRIPGAGQVVNLPVLIPDDLLDMLAPTAPAATDVRAQIARQVREIDPAWLADTVGARCDDLTVNPHAIALDLIANAIENPNR